MEPESLRTLWSSAELPISRLSLDTEMHFCLKGFCFGFLFLPNLFLTDPKPSPHFPTTEFYSLQTSTCCLQLFLLAFISRCLNSTPHCDFLLI